MKDSQGVVSALDNLFVGSAIQNGPQVTKTRLGQVVMQPMVVIAQNHLPRVPEESGPVTQVPDSLQGFGPEAIVETTRIGSIEETALYLNDFLHLWSNIATASAETFPLKRDYAHPTTCVTHVVSGNVSPDSRPQRSYRPGRRSEKFCELCGGKVGILAEQLAEFEC